ncbi:DMT family transporter [Pseudoclavibacter sp. AY1H1]|uniref:DMT family transporter n=1 Tax=Pseudoclavibacter sp. AY1H1 TaxID=2080584 RepID=UPI000CE78066|nr:DMT family transporter [Pseudoclavibacter sp. AY1H1]PPF33158.1 multidrug DMT transporter permease [Pseudoclavibacter sp. AY1H1]
MLIGIALALAAAAFMAVGNLLQSRGVHLAETRSSSRKDAAVHVLRNRIWLFGSIALVVAMLVQVGSLAFAPLIVVQPIGVAALVFSVVLTSILRKTRPSRAIIRSILLCVVGVGGFVVVAAIVSTQQPIEDAQLVAVLVTLGGVLVATGIVEVLGKGRPTPPLLWVLLGGVYSAFVATLGKTVILRVQAILKAHEMPFNSTDILTIASILGIGIAGALSVIFVQRAHLDNPPEVVVAGLTVIDPTIAVVLGIVILREATNAPLWAVVAFLVAGAVAITGVIQLARAENSPVDEVSNSSSAGERKG